MDKNTTTTSTRRADRRCASMPEVGFCHMSIGAEFLEEAELGKYCAERPKLGQHFVDLEAGGLTRGRYFERSWAYSRESDLHKTPEFVGC